jgi:hypothetical protein
MPHKSRGVQEEELAFLRGDYLKSETVPDSRFLLEPEINTSNSEGTFTYMYLYMYLYVYKCRHVCRNVCINIYTCVRIYVYLYMEIYMYTCIYIYIYI